MSKTTILVVDDAPSNIDLLRGILKPEYKVRAAISGEAALKIATSDNPPDLILLDVMMPGMDGYEVCRRLKADPSTQHIPVIFVTGAADDEARATGAALSAAATVAKPVDPAILLAIVTANLGHGG